MDLEPVVSLRVNGAVLTPRQLEVLLTVHREGSQRKAGERLGLATPVVHRYLGQIEAKAGVRLLDATPSGTTLTEEGRKLALEYGALLERMRLGDSVVVGCSIVTEELLLSTLTRLDPEARYDLIVSDDERNLKDFKAGLMDLVVLDDPLYAYELEDVEFDEIAGDRLIHVDRGEAYVRFRYGAQRIGFRQLEASGKPFRVEAASRSLASMARSSLSFFVNESLALKKGYKLTSSTDPNLLSFKILALYQGKQPEVEWLLRELKRERL